MMQVRRLHEGQTMSHAFGFGWRRLMTNKVVPIIPIHIDTHFPSNQPTPERCLKLGRAVRRAVESWSSAQASQSLPQVVQPLPRRRGD
jgi:hypothetical protein